MDHRLSEVSVWLWPEPFEEAMARRRCRMERGDRIAARNMPQQQKASSVYVRLGGVSRRAKSWREALENYLP